MSAIVPASETSTEMGSAYITARIAAIANASPAMNDLGDSAMRERQKAEQVYAETAFDFERDPIGSRDWELFWRGWQASSLSPEQIEEPARLLGKRVGGGRWDDCVEGAGSADKEKA